MGPYAIIIVDFDNRFPQDIDDRRNEIESLFSQIVRLIKNSTSVIRHIKIKLYGGWYFDDVLTNKASTLIQHIGNIEFFPIIHDGIKIDGSIELVSRLHGSDYVWYGTYKERRGLPKLRIKREATSDVCASKQQHCPIHILSRFTKSKSSICQIDGCNTLHSDVFFQKEQKMIDTMIACDLILHCEDDNAKCVYLVSDDIDLLPPVAVCRNKRPDMPISICYQYKHDNTFVSDFLSKFNVNAIMI